MISLDDYSTITGPKIIARIKKKAKKIKGKNIVAISSTHQGGGVAEILNSFVCLMNELGINFGWRIIHGTPDFFEITKAIHNGLQGRNIKLKQRQERIYLEINQKFSIYTHFKHDLVIVHDAQPLALINFYKKCQPWVWRCHVDLSNPDKKIWNFLSPYIKNYDEMVISDERYKKAISVKQRVIHPAIDPLSDKNKSLSEVQVKRIIKNLGLKLDRPIIAQVSRFDSFKDPMGVIKIFELVKKRTDCQLVLLGNTASDDPEGVSLYREIVRKYGRRHDIKILINVRDNDLAVNALQRSAAVVVQKSAKEGFGLVASEALYKGTPVVAANAGGLPLQIINAQTGFLHSFNDIKGFANSLFLILKNKKLRNQLGQQGRKHVINNFLITRLMEDWLDLLASHLNKHRN